jgi:c(7)-type cytochrome triheme protein
MRRWAIALAMSLLCALAWASAAGWVALAKDGLHDPANPGLALLQEPRDALGPIAARASDFVGNRVRWVQALANRQIEPRTNIHPETVVQLRTTEVLLKNTNEMPMVRFPHRQHTEWLDCVNCHDKLFNQVAGTTRINMRMILEGEKCGLCHGAVAFPLTECERCHTVVRRSDEHREFGTSLVREATPR